MASYQNLLSQKAALDRKIATARKREIATVIKQINQLIEQYQLKPSELSFSGAAAKPRAVTGKVKAKPGRKPKTGTPVAPKYRHPDTGETWSGRGRSPKWIEGDKSKYLIQPETSSDTPAE